MLFYFLSENLVRSLSNTKKIIKQIIDVVFKVAEHSFAGGQR